MTQYKSFDVKAADDGGVITGYASTWTREPDSYGDVVARGAFAESLANWAGKGGRIPFLFGHRTDDPQYNLGWAEAEEDDYGLRFSAYLDAESEQAQYVRKLYKEGRITQFSFAYNVLDQAPVELESGAHANELRKLDIFEISAVQIPANQHAEVIDVKDAETLEKAGRRNSAKDADDLARIKELCSSIESIIDGLLSEQRETPDEQEPEAEANEAEAKSEEPDTANDEEPQVKFDEVDSLLKQAQQLLEKEE